MKLQTLWRFLKVKNFYQSLYSSRENQLIDVDLDQLLNRDTPKISDADKERMEMQNVVTMEEAGKVLNNMKNDKSPGSDGFSVNIISLNSFGRIWAFFLLDL